MSERDERAYSVLQNLAADFIRREANSNPLITVTRVAASPDFKRATVFVSVFPENESNDNTVIHFLTRKGSEFRDYVKKHGAFKTIPFFDFKIDYGERNRQNVDRVTNRLEEEKSK